RIEGGHLVLHALEGGGRIGSRAGTKRWELCDGVHANPPEIENSSTGEDIRRPSKCVLYARSIRLRRSRATLLRVPTSASDGPTQLGQPASQGQPAMSVRARPSSSSYIS